MNSSRSTVENVKVVHIDAAQQSVLIHYVYPNIFWFVTVMLKIKKSHMYCTRPVADVRLSSCVFIPSARGLRVSAAVSYNHQSPKEDGDIMIVRKSQNKY